MNGHLITPDRRKIQVSFTPGVKGAYKGFKRCLGVTCDVLEWTWSSSKRKEMIEFAWSGSSKTGKGSINLIKNIPKGVLCNYDKIQQLVRDRSFAWVPRVCIKSVGGLMVAPICKLIGGSLGVLVLAPVELVGLLTLGFASKLVVGNITAVSYAACSFIPLTLGLLISTLIPLGAIFMRFPEPSDHSTYGLYLIKN
jgi:hypothetical protein